MKGRATLFRGMPPGRHGFTLIEVLVVVAIIALLVAILLPSLTAARGQSKRCVCMANLHQIHLGLMMYKESNQDRIPDWIAMGKWYFRRAPGMRDPTSPTSLQETFGLNALLAGVAPVEKGNMAGTRKKYLSGTSDVWRCPAAPGWMWDQWKNTYMNFKLTLDTDLVSGNLPTNVYTKLMMRVKRFQKSTGKAVVWDPSKISVAGDNYSWAPGNCGWMGADGWSSSAGYKLTNVSAPHTYSGRKGAAATVILWLDGNAGRTGGKQGL